MTPEEFAAYYGSGGGQGGPAPIPPVGLPGSPPPPSPGAAYYGAPPPPPPVAAPPLDLGAAAFGAPPPARIDSGGSANFGPGLAPPPVPQAPAMPPSQSAPPPQKTDLGETIRYFAGLGPSPLGPPTPEMQAPPAPKPAPMQSLRESSAASNRVTAGGPMELPPTPEAQVAARALAGYGGAQTGAPAPRPTQAPAGGGGYAGDDGAARRELYGTFDTEKHALQSLADAEMARSDAMAAGMAVIGADRVREAALQEARAQNEHAILSAYQEDTNRQLDDVRSQRVDPNRLYTNRTTGDTVAAIIGGALGGFAQAMSKSPTNSYIDQMNRAIDRDIAIQERQLDRNAKNVGERRGILSDMRMTYHDEDLARLQAKNLYYEGIKQQLQAQAAQYDSPTIQARADQAVNMVDRQQAALKLDEQAKRAAANAAAAAFARAERQREFENQMHLEDRITNRITANKSGAGLKEGQSPRERFVGVTQDENGNPVGYLSASGTEAAKARQQLASSRELIELAEKAKAIRAEQGMLGRNINRNNPDQLIQLYTPEWQTKIRSLENQIIGAIKKSEELGALDNGVERFAKPLAGNLDSRGSSADDRLNALIEATKTKMEIHNNQLSGQRAVMLPGEEVVQIGGANAPQNLKGSSGVDRRAP